MHESAVLSQHASGRRDWAEIEGRIGRSGCIPVCLPGRQDARGGRCMLEALLQQQCLENIPTNPGTCTLISLHLSNRMSG